MQILPYFDSRNNLKKEKKDVGNTNINRKGENTQTLTEKVENTQTVTEKVKTHTLTHMN